MNLLVMLCVPLVLGHHLGVAKDVVMASIVVEQERANRVRRARLVNWVSRPVTT